MPSTRSRPTFSNRAADRRGVALGLVLFAVVIFLIIGAALLSNTYNEIPAVARLDRHLEARYFARSLAEAVRLKLKNHPEEFAEALRERELATNPDDPATTPLYTTYLSDFADPAKIRDALGIGDDHVTGRLLGFRRLYVGGDEVESDADYVTDVVDLAIECRFVTGGERGMRDSSEVTLRLSERIRFKRRFGKS